MKSIAFTDKQEHVFTRFNALRRAYEDANGGGRVYNPDFLTVLMDAWEERSILFEAIQKLSEQLNKYERQAVGQKGALIEFTPITSYATNAEAKEPLFLKEQPKRKKTE